MARLNPLTASERRGILAVAFIALLITASGLLLSLRGPSEMPDKEEVEIWIANDTVKQTDNATGINSKSGKSKGKKSGKTKKGSKKKGKKTYGTRNPLDEEV